MESHPAQPAALSVGSPCRREPLRGRRCLFFHSEDEIASASVVGQDQPPDVSLMVRIARLEQAVAQFVGVPVLHIMEDLVDGMQAVPQELVPDGSGEQTGLVLVPQIMDVIAERTHAHFGREPFEKDGRQYFDCEDHQVCRVPADSMYRHGCRYACGDATTGPANSDAGDDAGDDRGNPPHSGDQARRNSADAVHPQGWPLCLL